MGKKKKEKRDVGGVTISIYKGNKYMTADINLFSLNSTIEPTPACCRAVRKGGPWQIGKFRPLRGLYPIVSFTSKLARANWF